MAKGEGRQKPAVLDRDGFQRSHIALQLYRTAPTGHGITYRYEESLTRNGMVTWQLSRQREVLGK